MKNQDDFQRAIEIERQVFDEVMLEYQQKLLDRLAAEGLDFYELLAGSSHSHTMLILQDGTARACGLKVDMVVSDELPEKQVVQILTNLERHGRRVHVEP